MLVALHQMLPVNLNLPVPMGGAVAVPPRAAYVVQHRALHVARNITVIYTDARSAETFQLPVVLPCPFHAVLDCTVAPQDARLVERLVRFVVVLVRLRAV